MILLQSIATQWGALCVSVNNGNGAYYIIVYHCTKVVLTTVYIALKFGGSKNSRMTVFECFVEIISRIRS